MKYLKSALVIAALAAAGFLAAQKADDGQKGPRPTDVGRSPEGVEFQMPEMKPIALREIPPLSVERFEVNVLAGGTHAGQPGDLLLTFHGRGFLATSKSPTVWLGDGEVILDDTLTDIEGTLLYVVISRELQQKIKGLEFREVVVVNPGGLQDTKYGHVSVPATPAELLQPAEGAPSAQLLYEKGEFVRRLMER